MKGVVRVLARVDMSQKGLYLFKIAEGLPLDPLRPWLD